ncbi:MAG: O-antigen ligase family protein [Hyphomicrobiaceae bacterium]
MTSRSLPRAAPALPSTAELLLWLSAFLPTLAIAYPLLVWPLIEGKPASEFADFMPASPSAEPSSLNRLYFPPLFLLASAAFVLWHRALGATVSRLPLWLMGLLLGWAGMTAFWGLEPGLVTRRLMLQITVIAPVLLPVLIARRPEDVLRPAFWLVVLVTLVNTWMVLTHPPTKLGHAGIYPHKNVLGAVMGIDVVFALYMAATGRALERLAAAFVLVVSLGILVASKSKTSIGFAVMAPAIGLGMALAARLVRMSPAVVMAALAGGLAFVYQLGVASQIWDFETVAGAIFGDPTLTRRTDIWDFAIKMIGERPVLGWGYESFWGISYEAPSYREAPGFVAKMPHAHNAYLDAWLQTGLPGLVLLVLLILASLHAAGRVGGRPFALTIFALTAMTYAIGHNCFESEFFHAYNIVSMMFVLAIALSVRSWSPP